MTSRQFAVRCVLFVSVATASMSASAAPIAQYNPATGNVRIFNDISHHFTPGFLEALSIRSRSGHAFVEDPTAYTLPHATSIVDTSELPENVNYLHVPLGWSNFGNIVVAGTPASDLYLPEIRFTDSGAPVPHTEFVTVPEPTFVGFLVAGGLCAAAVRPRNASPAS